MQLILTVTEKWIMLCYCFFMPKINSRKSFLTFGDGLGKGLRILIRTHVIRASDVMHISLGDEYNWRPLRVELLFKKSIEILQINKDKK